MEIDIWVMDIHNWIMGSIDCVMHRDHCIFKRHSPINKLWISIIQLWTSIIVVNLGYPLWLTLVHNSATNIHNWITNNPYLYYGYPLLNIYFNIHNWTKFKFRSTILYRIPNSWILDVTMRGKYPGVNIIFIGWSLSWPGHLMILRSCMCLVS